MVTCNLGKVSEASICKRKTKRCGIQLPVGEWRDATSNDGHKDMKFRNGLVMTGLSGLYAGLGDVNYTAHQNLQMPLNKTVDWLQCHFGAFSSNI